MDPAAIENVAVPIDTYNHLITVAKAVYNGGYVNNTMTYSDRKTIRAEAYRALNALGLEK